MNDKNKGWREKRKPIVTKRGIEQKAPRHYEVSVKKDLGNVLRRPLVMVDSDDVKIVEKEIRAKTAVEQFQERRLLYKGENTIIRETMQNSERIARDRKVPVDIIMTFTDDSFKIEDNAGGVTKETIETVFKIGESGYVNLGEETMAFGEGFISFLKLFGKAEVISNDVNAEFDWNWIEEQYKKDKNFNIMKAYKVAEYPDSERLGAKGKFIAIFTKPVPEYQKEKAIKVAKEIAKTMPVRSIIINGEEANNKIDFNITPRNFVRVEKKYGEKDGIIGYFAPGKEGDYLRFFDNGAPVGSVSGDIVDNRCGDLRAIYGHVNIKHTFYGQANKARDDWIQDSKIERTISFIRGLAKEKAIDYVKYAPESAMEDLQHFISLYTSFEDIKYHVRFDVIEPEVLKLVEKSERAKHQAKTEEEFKRHMAEILKSPSKLYEAVEDAKNYSPVMDANAYNEKKKQLAEEKSRLQQEAKEVAPKPETPKDERQSSEQQAVEDKQKLISEKEEELEKDKDATDKKRKSVEEKIDEFLDSRSGGGLTAGQWKKETFWCQRKEVEEYTDTIKMASYYHINVAIAENKFQRQVFESFDNFRHLRELSSSMSIVPKISQPGAKNVQERRIEFIIRAFLDAGGYNNVKMVIANITANRVITLRGSQKKTDEEIGLVAYADMSANTIYLQRTMNFGYVGDGYEDYTGVKALYPFLEYNDFPTDNKSIGQGDIAVFSKIRKTLSHELAHLIYNTKDDTADHYKSMIIIDATFDKVIAEFKASSHISDSLIGLNKKAKDRIGVQKGDKVILTATKAVEGTVEKQDVPIMRRTSMNDLYYSSATNDIFTYRKLIEEYDSVEDLQKSIADGIYKYIGFKLGDMVLFKNDSDEENTGIVKEISKYGSSTVGIIVDGGSTIPRYYPWGKVIKTMEKTKPKYAKGEIFVREDGGARSYKELLGMYSDESVTNLSIESGKYKPSGLKVGDRVIFDEGKEVLREGIIKGTWGSDLRIIEDDEDMKKADGYEVHRSVSEVKKKVTTTRTDQLSFDDLLKGGT